MKKCFGTHKFAAGPTDIELGGSQGPIVTKLLINPCYWHGDKSNSAVGQESPIPNNMHKSAVTRVEYYKQRYHNSKIIPRL